MSPALRALLEFLACHRAEGVFEDLCCKQELYRLIDRCDRETRGPIPMVSKWPVEE